MESTKGKMNMHFETIAKDQTGNADRRMPTVNAHCITNIPTANAMQADGASAQLLKTDEETERKTKKPKPRNFK